MTRPCFLITIDTEGDNLWARPRRITTRNALFLPRFQALCEREGLRPTWLTNYEMVASGPYVEFATDLLKRRVGEVGMHLHAWNSPPLVPLTSDDYHYQPFLIEYPTSILEDKVARLTELLEATFECKMTSHRAGRWAMDGRYVRALASRGYLVDCSVTPHVSWRHAGGAPQGQGGTDYSAAPEWPYLLGEGNITEAGPGPLLEVPMTTRLAYPRLLRWLPPSARGWRVCAPVSRARLWLRPKPGNLKEMVALVKRASAEGWPYVQFMLHSSEFMPGGSPTFRTERDIEQLYDDLDILFSAASSCCDATTVTEYATRWQHAATAG